MDSQIRITVGGIKYSIISDESEEYLVRLGRELEVRLDHLAKKNPFLSTTMVAVLAALEGYDEAKKARAEYEELKEEINKLLEELTVLKSNAALPKELFDDEEPEDEEPDEE